MKKLCGVLLTMAMLVGLFMGDSMVANAQTVSYSPEEIYEVLTNPYMGWVPEAVDTNYAQPHTMVYAPLLWSELQPNSPDEFDFKSFEKKNHFEHWENAGVKINIRFFMDLPGDTIHRDIPDWLYNNMGEDKGSYYDCSVGKGFSPNYYDSYLIEAHEKAIVKIAERYNENSSIAFIQMGSLGHWGEWHCWPDVNSNPAEGGPSGVFPDEDTAEIYVDHYIHNFSPNKLCMRRATYPARDNKMGLFNDMIGDTNQTNTWLNGFTNGYSDDLGQHQPSMPDFWKYNVSGGEFANGDAASHLKNDVFAETLRHIKEGHTSWIGPCTPARISGDKELQANMDTLMKTMGYRFVLKTIKHPDTAVAGSTIPVNLDLRNRGVAPFYFNWSVRLGLADGNGVITYTKVSTDIREWLPGSKNIDTSLIIPSTVKPGKYTVVLGIIDPATGQPGINLAIKGKRSDGWYALDTIKVTGSENGSGNDTGNDSGTIDWSTITPVTYSSGQSATAVKVTNDSNYLYMRVEGTNLGEHTQIFLDSDNKKDSGYIDKDWASAGMDYMFEGKNLYYHKTNDGTWSWSGVTGVTCSVDNKGSYIDMKISRSVLNGTIAFTVKDVDGSWAVVSTLPWKNNYAYYTMK